MELGRRRSESRPSVSARLEIFTRQGRRAVIQLGFCVFANSKVRRGAGSFRRVASLFSLLATIGGYTYVCWKKNHSRNYDIAVLVLRVTTSNKLFDIYLYFLKIILARGLQNVRQIINYEFK